MNYYLFTTDLRRAGVQRVVSIMAERWTREAAVTIILLRHEVEFDLPKTVRVITLDLATGPLAFFSGAMLWRAKRRLQAILADNNGPFVLFSFLESPNLLSVFLKRRFASGVFIGGIHVNVLMYGRIFHCLYPHYGKLDALISCSQGNRLLFVNRFAIPPEKIVFIPNPVDFAAIETLSRMPVPEALARLKDGHKLILAVGRLEKVKNFSMLLHAFAGMPVAENTAHLVILGEGPERSYLTRLARRLGISSRLTMPGKVDNPYVWMTHSDLFVLSSNNEGWPMALVEAMACGLPIVATDCQTGPAEILHHGMFGPLVPIGDAAAMSAAMAGQLNSGKKAYPFLREWDADLIAERYRALAQDILDRRAP
jgi:glycosyltransferase involved in cell wall biosynthesis